MTGSIKKIKIIGAGWFGCHLACSLLQDGHTIELHDVKSEIFAGASGKIPARLHLGAPHYPRSMVTQQACKDHQESFIKQYGNLTRAVPINIYAVASDHSMVDFGMYHLALKNQIEILTIQDPSEFGLQNVEGAVMTGERHIVVQKAKKFFEEKLKNILHLKSNTSVNDKNNFDYIIDCTFCANDNFMVDRFEPCLVLALEGPAYKAVTIMDGPFPSLYPWDEDKNLVSLSSAKYTPFSKNCKTWTEANNLLNSLTYADIVGQGKDMIESMAHFYPEVYDYKIADYMLSIRAMPLSAADSRLVDVVKLDDTLIRIRSGKIDAVIEAEQKVKDIINE